MLASAGIIAGCDK